MRVQACCQLLAFWGLGETCSSCIETDVETAAEHPLTHASFACIYLLAFTRCGNRGCLRSHPAPVPPKAVQMNHLTCPQELVLLVELHHMHLQCAKTQGTAAWQLCFAAVEAVFRVCGVCASSSRPTHPITISVVHGSSEQLPKPALLAIAVVI